MEYLIFDPIFQERVWGGRRLETLFGRALPGSGPVGESWEVSDRPEACSVVAEGPWAGRTLREVLEVEGERVMGPGWPGGARFPILVKWLDCRERLSLQVHPPAAMAVLLGGEPKTENWYVVEADPGAGLLAGLRRGVTPDSFALALREERLEPLLHRIPVEPGDSLFVPSGRLHAIDAGNLILEIQQNSDTTYRVYDWGRLGLDGKPRTLHLEESMQSIDFGDFEPALTVARGAAPVVNLVEAEEFRLQKRVLEPGQSWTHGAQEEPRLLHLVEGKLRDESTGREIRPGSNLLLPFFAACALTALDRAIVLVTSGFGPVAQANT